MAKQPPPLQENTPRPAVNISLQMIFQATNVPQAFGSCEVLPGLAPQLGGSNGSAANAQNAFVALSPEKLVSGNGRTIVPPSISAADAVTFAVNNTSQIWAMGTEGDGIQLVIRGTQIG